MNAAYVAGFFDADGCVSIGHTRGGRGFSVHVIVVQKNNTVTQMLLDHYGGTMNITRRGDRKYHRWMMHGQACTVFLNDILPYVVDKREQVELALEACAHQKASGEIRYVRGKVGTQPLLKEALEYRRQMWVRMKHLNTCHKSRAAATTEPSDGNGRCDSLSLAVMSRGDTNARATKVA